MHDEARFQDKVMETLARFREDTVMGICKRNLCSKQHEAEHSEAQRDYMMLLDELPREKAEKLERYVGALEAADNDMADNAYLAGIYDAIRVMATFGFLR